MFEVEETVNRLLLYEVYTIIVFCAGVNAYLGIMAIFSSGLVSLSEYTNLVVLGFSLSFFSAFSSAAGSFAAPEADG